MTSATTTSPEQFGLAGKHILVTGGGRGLGQAIALSAANCGAHVTIVARSIDQLRDTQHKITALGSECGIVEVDLSRTRQLDSLVEDVWTGQGPIHGVVHAAGVQVRKPAVDISVEDWAYLHSVNTDAPFFISTAVARRQLDDALTGSHVFIGSLNSTIGLPRLAPYAASKSAMLGMVRVMSSEWSGRGIRANVLAPGYFETELTKDLFADEANRTRVLSRIPMGHLGHGADVGAAAVFLLSDASRYISGQLMNVDGGWLAS